MDSILQCLHTCYFQKIVVANGLALYATCLARWDADSRIRLSVVTLPDQNQDDRIAGSALAKIHEIQFCDVITSQPHIYVHADLFNLLQVDGQAGKATEALHKLDTAIVLDDTPIHNYATYNSTDGLLILLRKPRNHKYLPSVMQSSGGYKQTGQLNHAIAEWNTRIIADSYKPR